MLCSPSFQNLTSQSPSSTLSIDQSDQNTSLVDATRTSGLACSDLAGRPGIAGWDIESGIAQEEVPRSQQHRHGLGGHDRVVLGGGEVRQAECVPEHDVFVLNVLSWVGIDPQRETLRWLAGRLGHVATGWVDLVVGVCGQVR